MKSIKIGIPWGFDKYVFICAEARIVGEDIREGDR